MASFVDTFLTELTILPHLVDFRRSNVRKDEGIACICVRISRTEGALGLMALALLSACAYVVRSCLARAAIRVVAVFVCVVRCGLSWSSRAWGVEAEKPRERFVRIW